jgi:hypothetical protein
LSFDIGYYQERYGDVPHDALVKMVGAESVDAEIKRLLLHRMQNLVSTLAEAMGIGIEGEGGHCVA